MKKLFFWLSTIVLFLSFSLFLIFNYCYVGGCGSPQIVGIVKLSKKLITTLFPSETLDSVGYKNRSMVTYVDENGKKVYVFGGYFYKLDVENMTLWIRGDNNQEYAFSLDPQEEISFIDLKTEIPEELNLKIPDLEGFILSGEYINVYWEGSDYQENNIDNTIVNSSGSTLYQIDRYRTNGNRLIR